jgi:mannose/fructose/N-acetylgalactosamine-specific phosphotransferase system component IIC
MSYFYCKKPKKEVRMILHYELANYIQILIFSLAVIGIIAAIFYAGHSHKG